MSDHLGLEEARGERWGPPRRMWVIRRGSERARVGGWRGDNHTALLVPLPEPALPSAAFVGYCCEVLAQAGYAKVVTPALAPLEQAAFLAAGFDVEERLHLLGIDLSAGLPPVPPGPELRRVRRRQHAEVLQVDSAAFPPFWRLDPPALADALRATSFTRFRCASGGDGRALGYAVCGRAAGKGFVQRLAVHPDAQGCGLGRRLLLDGLHWLRRRHVGKAVVNTQVGNVRALSLYRRVGFVEEPSGLSVLSARLP